MKENHEFSERYNIKKANLLAALEKEEKISSNQRAPKSMFAVKLLVAAAAIFILSVGVFAVSHFIEFRAEQKGYEVEIKASIGDNVTDRPTVSTDRPVLAWRAEEGEISVKLNFGYMPEEMYVDFATPYKYKNEEFTKSITFIGHDLLRDSFADLLGGVRSTEEFNTGSSKGYIVFGSEADFYNKMLYLLFEKEKLVIKAYVSYGVTVDELKDIAKNMTVSFTDEAAEALPISNEPKGGDASIPEVYYSEPNPIYYADMYFVGETAEHKGYFDTVTTEITVISQEITNNIAGLDKSNFLGYKFIEKFIDESGKFIPYARTEYIRGDGINSFSSFGETEYLTKKLIVLTVKLTGKEGHDAESFLHSFSLYDFNVEDDGEITPKFNYDGYVYDSTPGTRTGTYEAVYQEYLGDDLWRIGFILDEEETKDELVWLTTKNAIGENLGFIIK